MVFRNLSVMWERRSAKKFIPQIVKSYGMGMISILTFGYAGYLVILLVI